MEGVVLWNINNGQPIKKMKGNIGMTIGILSPQGKYAITGDEDYLAYRWNLHNMKRLKLLGSSDKSSHCVSHAADSTCHSIGQYNMMPVLPKDAANPLDLGYQDRAAGLRFIDKTHFLRFGRKLFYTMLYSVSNSAPIKYLPLGHQHAPWVVNIHSQKSIVSSVSTHTLVMAQAGGKGLPSGDIVVYQYHPKTQTLVRQWVGALSDALAASKRLVTKTH